MLNGVAVERHVRTLDATHLMPLIAAMIATITVIAAITLAVIAMRLDRRAIVLASEAEAAAADAAKLAERAMSLASLAIERVSSSRASRLAEAASALAASKRLTTSMASPCLKGERVFQVPASTCVRSPSIP